MSTAPRADDDNLDPTSDADAAADDGALPKAYNHEEVEARWYSRWSDAGVFSADAKRVLAGDKAYVVMMPPPNVTGSLHMGHALFVTIQDILTRTHRMRGEVALWLPGVDHAGIATQSVVERELKRHEGLSRHDVGRAAFLERVWAWKDKNGTRIVEQLKGMGASADWSRERFTMDEQCNRAVREAFVRMWNDGLIYRGERLVSWDPTTQTALSDEEVEHEEKDGELWRFAYKLKGGPLQVRAYSPAPDNAPAGVGNQGAVGEAHCALDDAPEIVVATTRPETMLGDVAVAVHPDDERYQTLIGQELVHPFFKDRKVVVVADASVDREFGTGAVKITPAHDPNDFELGQRHSLPSINILTIEGAINDGGAAFMGQDRFIARKQVKRVLEELGLFRGTTPFKHNVSVSQRSGAVVEPMLSRQFFVKSKPLADKAYAATQSGETKIVPAFWEKTWDHWMLNIRDWCISRQLWWGHRIPVFYDLTQIDECIEADANRKGKDTEGVRAQADGVRGKALLQIALRTLDDDLIMKFSVASTDDLAANDPERYVQEDDVLDTWFSSGLWPFSTLGWPDVTDDLKAFYPDAAQKTFAVLETGSDILFFWVARMVMMGTYFMERSPFQHVFLHAIVRDAYGKKMSKSEGNALDPLDVIAGIGKDALIAKTKTYPIPEKKLAQVLKGLEKEYPDGIPAAGADGLRFTLAALSAQGRDVKLSIPRAAGYKQFLNKIWNATRFALMRLGDGPIQPVSDVKLGLGDRWILSRLQQCVKEVSAAIDEYRFDAMANAFYQFFWTELCDVYIEVAKGSLELRPGDPAREATRATLVHVLDASMRLLHPTCPFQTEEIWQILPGREERHAGVAFCAQAPWPVVDAALIDERAERELGLVNDVLGLVRNVRQESGLSPRKPVVVDLVCGQAASRDILQHSQALLTRLAVIETLNVKDAAGYSPPGFAAVHAKGAVEVVVHLEGLVDPAKEKERLAREIQKATKDKEGLSRRFDNADFVKKAPPEVVEQGKLDMAALDDKLQRLNAAMKRLP